MPGTALAPLICRDFVRRAVCALGHDGLADTAALCTSELVTNVHQHAKGDVHLRATVDLGGVRVAVYDGTRSVPARCSGGEDAEGGRGLVLVEGLADGFGVTKVREGKGVWFWLAAEGE